MAVTMNEVAEHLVAEGTLSADELQVCTPAEIDEIRQAQRLTSLPGEYESFLPLAGRRLGAGCAAVTPSIQTC